MTGRDPLAMPSLWWSPSWGVLTEYTIGAGTFYDHTRAALDALRELPADAVRLVPDVSRVRCDWCTGITSLDDEGMVVAHLRPDDGASCPGSHADDFERVPDTVQAPDVAAAVLAAAGAWKARYDEMFDEPPARGTTMRPIYDALLGADTTTGSAT